MAHVLPGDEGPASKRLPLALLLGAVIFFTAVGWVSDVLGPRLITERPLLQILLNPRLRYLILASPQLDAIPFFVVGFFRLVVADPVFYLLGLQYGDAARSWAEEKMGDDVGAFHRLERLFSKAAYPIVALAPNGYVCLLAGATGMRVRTFLALNLGGTVVRLVVIRALGEAFEDELLDLLDVIQRYQWWLVAASFLVVLAQVRRQRSRGTLESPAEMQAEILEAERRPRAEGETSPTGEAPEQDSR